jgi:hypothetical protein
VPGHGKLHLPKKCCEYAGHVRVERLPQVVLGFGRTESYTRGIGRLRDGIDVLPCLIDGVSLILVELSFMSNRLKFQNFVATIETLLAANPRDPEAAIITGTGCILPHHLSQPETTRLRAEIMRGSPAMRDRELVVSHR